MNREGIIVIICIGIVVLFYLFQNNTAAVEQVELVKEPIVQSSDDRTKGSVQQRPKEVYSSIPDSLDKKENQEIPPR